MIAPIKSADDQHNYMQRPDHFENGPLFAFSRRHQRDHPFILLKDRMWKSVP